MDNSKYFNPGDVVILKKLDPITLDIINSKKFPKQIQIDESLFKGQKVWLRRSKVLLRGDETIKCRHPVTSVIMEIIVLNVDLLKVKTVHSTYYIQKVT